MFVPVVDEKHKPLMPTTLPGHVAGSRAGKPHRFGSRVSSAFGLTSSLLTDTFNRLQSGSTQLQKEGYSIVSAAHTYLNLQANTVDWVTEAVRTRRQMRRTRQGVILPAGSHGLIACATRGSFPLLRKPAGSGSCDYAGGSYPSILSQLTWSKISKLRRLVGDDGIRAFLPLKSASGGFMASY